MSAPNKNYDPVEVTALSPEEVDKAVAGALAAIAAAQDLDELKAARLAHIGNKAPLTLAGAEIKALPPSARSDAGKRIGKAKAQVNEALTARTGQLERERDERVLVTETVDVTLPFDRTPPGARHPVALTMERLSDVFTAMGYEVAEGPEVEAEWYNFDALNVPPDHPAREMQDTLFAARSDGQPGRSGAVLRTQTSPLQIRSLLSRSLPLYIVSPGRVYRNEAPDATHLAAFHQIEGLAVDEGLTMADLRGAIQAFVDAMFGGGLKTRLRPDYFPFTEPSGEVAMECHLCRGATSKLAAQQPLAAPGAGPCRVCKSTGWVEIAGCGMVNPRVLVACGVDPDRYSGFAFGLGIERALMLAHGVSDIRDTVEGDVRFSRPFGMEI